MLDTELSDAVAFCDRSIRYFRELAASEAAAFEGDLASVEALRREVADRTDTD
ncbi:hypothetical protein [Glycomyces halotolerans]